MNKVVPIYPGWLVHAGLFFCAALVIGSSSYTFGLFVVPVTSELGFDRASISNGYISLLLGVALLSPLIGRLLDLYSARMVILTGGLSYSLGLYALTLSDNGYIIIALIFLPIAYGYTACGTLAVNTVIVRWFQKRRGRALGIMAASTSAGGFIMAPFTAAMIDGFDWRVALQINSGIVLTAVLLMVALLIRNHPTSSTAGYAEEFPESEEDAAGDDRSSGTRAMPYRDLLRQRNFWLITLAIGLMLFCDQAMVTAQAPYFQDIGIDLTSAAFILSCMTASAIGGKLVVGHLSDKFDLRFIFVFVAAVHIALQVLYLLGPSYWTLLIFATLFGIGIGGVYPAWSMLTAAYFGTQSYGSVLGLMTIITKAMAILGVRMVGEIYDTYASYEPAFYVFIVAASVSIVLAFLLESKVSADTKSR